MAAISSAFDTHDAVKRLEKAGFQSPQAEAITETVRLLDDAQRSDSSLRRPLAIPALTSEPSPTGSGQSSTIRSATEARKNLISSR